MALKKEHENKPFNEWYDDFKFKVWHAMDWYKGQYATLIDQYRFMLFLFYCYSIDSEQSLIRFAHTN